MLVNDKICDDGGMTLSLLREQHALYGQLEAFAGRQRRLVTGDDTDSLLVLLAERQKVASRLTDIARALAPIREDWASYRNQLVPSQREEAEQLLAESRGRLQKVIESDEQDARLLQVRKAKTSRSLGQVSAGGQAINAYQVTPHRSGRFDQTDEEAS